MSSSAGRVLLIPKGEYNSATQYSLLDVVTYEHDSYVAKQTTQGNAPTNTTYWQKLTDVGEEVDELGSEIQALTNYVADNNVKNMCPTFPASGSAAGVDYTTAANGIVTGVGTSTGQTAFYAVNQVANVLPAGNYIASAGSNASENLRLVVLIKRANNSSVYIECTSSQDKPFTVYADDQYMSIYIRTNGGNTAINGTIAPMIRLASITDPTYQPYAKTNAELTQDVTPVNAIASVSVPSGTMSSDSYLYKVGKIVIAYFQITGVTASANDFVCTIPEGYRPLKNINGACKKSGDDSLRIMPVLYTGNVQTPTALSDNTFTMSAMTWITA